MFGRKRGERLAGRWEEASSQRSYGKRLWRRFRQNRQAVWSLRVLYGLVFIAVFADFLANEKPLYCRIEGRDYYPVLRQYAVDLGLAKWEARFVNADWRDQPYQRVAFAPVPYSAHTLDRSNMNYRGPFGPQQVASWRFRHWLGTDQIGRDVLAGLIRGARTALLVGIAAMSVAALLGMFFGAIAGYFGDYDLQVSRIRLWLNLLGLATGLFYGFGVRAYALEEGPLGRELLLSLGIVLLLLALANLIAGALRRLPALGKKAILPVDTLVMRLIEIINAIPALLLILSVVAVVRRPSTLHVMAIIGLLSWTSIARFVRAEMLSIRRREYVEAARALGFSSWRIILRHALPNALRPVLITVAFGVAGAILLEASLSFLGIGLVEGEVTWGALLNLARANTGAWWLAVFPGMAIFVTVTVFNLLGDALTDAVNQI